MYKAISLLTLGVMLVVAPAAFANSVTFVKIDPGNATVTTAKSINPQGDIVGFFRDTDGKNHGFLRTKHASHRDRFSPVHFHLHLRQQ